ncbi:MAG: hypothetical protein R3268_06600 [Acidiferrobacterales bacterium]|nr:hypothetical protein [Acidiferrobacterales bacterium]
MNTLRNLLFSTLAVLVLFTAVGCDSNDDDQSDAELFIGSWNAVGVSDGTGDQTAGFASSVSQFRVTFKSNDTYDLSVAFTDERSPIQFSGAPYTVTESSNSINLIIPAAVAGTQLTFPFTYNFENDDRVALTLGSSALPFLNVLFGTTYVNPVTVTVAR